MVGNLGPVILIFGALAVYFGVLCQNIYPIIFLILEKCNAVNENDYIANDDHPILNAGKFSLFYVAIVMIVIIIAICLKKDLTIFIKMSLVGVGCLIILIAFVIYEGISAIAGNTKYEFVPSKKDDEPASIA